jgi:hypothetical protein
MQGGGTNLLQWLAAGGLVGIVAALFDRVGLHGETFEAVAPLAVAAAGVGCLVGLAIGGLKSLLTRRR